MTISAKGPLAGLKVLDFTHVIAGPFTTRILADMGADVVKVNSARRAAAGPNHPDHPFYLMWNRNKRALGLDMTHEEDRKLCRSLAEQADVVIDNFSVGVLERWGVGYELVSETNPGVVYVQMSGMGTGGPWSNYVTYAPTIHALCGLTCLTGVPGREDIGVGLSYNDHQAGLHGAVAILAALESRHHSGRGQHIDLSQFEVGVNFSGPSLLDLFANNVAAEPVGNKLPYDRAAPHGCFPCLATEGEGFENERWIAIACMTDAHWHSLARLIDKPWTQDPSLETVDGRLLNHESLEANLIEFTSAEEAYDLMARCQAAGVPAGVVQSGRDLAEHDEQLRATGFLEKIDQDPDVWADVLPIRFSKHERREYTRARHVGADNAAVLGDWLGIAEAEVRQSEADGRLQ